MPFLAGGLAEAADVNGVRTMYKKKAAAQSVTNSATLVNDADIVLTLAANKTYLIEAHIAASGPAAQDVRIAWSLTGGAAAFNRMVAGPGSAATATTGDVVRMTGTHALTTNIVYGTDGTNNSHIYEMFGVETISTGTTATLTLQWAQGTAAAATTTTLASTTFVLVREIEAL